LVVSFFPVLFFSAFFFFLPSILADFAFALFLTALFLSDPFFFRDLEGLLAFFEVFPADFAPFLDRASLLAEARDDFDPFPAEALVEAVFFPVFFEALPERFPDRPLASFLPERLFFDAIRVRDFFFPDFRSADFLPFFFELFVQLDPEPNEGLPFVFGSMVEGLYSSFNRRRYCSWSSRTLSLTWLSSCWAKQPNAKMAEIETTADNMSILHNLMGTPLIESRFGPVAEG
jgi:hypothetical protein